MSEEATTPDLVELTRRTFASGDLDVFRSLLAPDAVWDISPMELGIFEGPAAIGAFWEDWIGSYEEWETEPEEIVNLGRGVIFGVFTQRGRPVGTVGEVQQTTARVFLWVDDVIARITSYTDLDEARAAAERLAEEQG